MKTFSKLLSAIFLTLLILENVSCSNSDSRYFEAMDTFMKIQSNGKNSKKANLLAEQRIKQIENLFSVTKSESDIYRINSENKNEFEVRSETISAIKLELKIAQLTDGALNPALYPVTKSWGFTTGIYRIPEQKELEKLLKLTDYNYVTINDDRIYKQNDMMFDLGAVGKGFAGDEAIKVLKSKGIKSALLDLGGNIQTLGTKPDGSLWKIGIKDPWTGEITAGVSLSDQVLITSGGYERYFTTDDGQKFIHILDGRTGKPVDNEIVSSSIITSSGAYGDVLSTATFILGKDEAVNLWKKLNDFEMVLIFEDHSICYTKGLEGNISFLGNFKNIEIVK